MVKVCYTIVKQNGRDNGMLTSFDNFTFQIVYAFRTKHSDGFFRVPARAFAALSYRVAGTGRFVLDGKVLTVQRGDLLYIPAGMAYEVEYSSAEMIVVHLTDCNYPDPEVITPSSPALLGAAFEELLAKWNERHSSHLAKSQIYGLLELLATDQKSTEGKDQTLLSRCIALMESHFCESELNVEQICKRAYICRSTLQRTFKRQLGVSPQQYLSKLRLNRALHLLGQGASVKEAAMTSGFSDEKYFSRVFKSTYGYSPSQVGREA